ncbi:helicase-related protein [Methylobacterium gossipiicola]|uniref:ATP-dependent RNA helicase SUPV3L1/SUV3 n=1 Tax=Methylobacterium gossipiicola TaxID=582675 RepID=A0A1I2XAU8_9HYPH|nr:helicase-related protein [Methylobacterium gossipiicola]SFH10117.1 ATP-dependent RNA helicase SUPV3L1/SUV3 [Methylobacterium gossipiicola]
MARRIHRTTDFLADALHRLGIAAGAVDREALRERLGLPERGGVCEDAAVAQALRASDARRDFARNGVPALIQAIPALRAETDPDGTLHWRVRVLCPLLDDNRLDLRIDTVPDAEAAEILDEMALGNDPSWRLDALRARVLQTAGRLRGSLNRTILRLRDQIRADMTEAGADAVTYIAHLDRSLRSRVFADGPDAAATILDTLKAVRARGRVVAQEASGTRRLRDRAGFGSYIDKFAAARRLNRRIVFHMGPTNSGKTYAAVEALTKAATGAYLAPLRLLALENYEALAARGLRAGMVTGEEILGEADPTHTARTIETADLRRPIDVAVIDEIQMLSDPDRGWAWTNALFGIPARLVIVCGAEDALSAVRRAAEAAGESLDVVTFTRKTPLIALDAPVPLEEVAPGDAVVAFSRRAVHEHRETLVAAGRSVATIYGALSPEVRRAEATRFRDGEAEVLVTTDAIGMGLNLGPLKRVIFAAVRKWDGSAERALTNAEIRQIAGRAGRFGHQEAGYVAATDDDAMGPVRDALSGAPTAPAADTRFFVRPDLAAIEAAAAELGTDSLSAVMAHFTRATFYEGSPFQPSALDEFLGAAEAVDQVSLPIREKFAFAVTPIDRRDPIAVAVVARWLQARALGASVPALRADPHGDLAYQERTVRLASAYLWLARRFPDTFDDGAAMRAVRERANAAIERTLRETATLTVTQRARMRETNAAE